MIFGVATMPNVSEILRAELRALRANYSAQLPLKFQELEKVWELAQQESENVQHLSNLHLLVHRLSGSGATYGFSALSEEARTLEIYLKPFIEGENSLTEAQKVIIST